MNPHQPLAHFLPMRLEMLVTQNLRNEIEHDGSIDIFRTWRIFEGVDCPLMIHQKWIILKTGSSVFLYSSLHRKEFSSNEDTMRLMVCGNGLHERRTIAVGGVDCQEHYLRSHFRNIGVLDGKRKQSRIIIMHEI